jgi:hypothetical protein
MRVCFLLVCLLFVPAPAVVSAQSGGEQVNAIGDEVFLQRVLQHYTDTYGGLRDMNSLNSISVSGTQIQGDRAYFFRLLKKRPISLRYTVEKGDAQVVTGFDGQTGWRRMDRSGEVEVARLTGRALGTIRHEADFEGPLFRSSEKPENAITLTATDRVEGVETYVIRVESPDQPTRLFYLEKEHAQLLRLDHLDASGQVEFQTFYRDYRTIEGYPFAFEVENRVGGRTVSLTRIEEVEINPGLLSFMFEMPKP